MGKIKIALGVAAIGVLAVMAVPRTAVADVLTNVFVSNDAAHPVPVAPVTPYMTTSYLTCDYSSSCYGYIYGLAANVTLVSITVSASASDGAFTDGSITIYYGPQADPPPTVPMTLVNNGNDLVFSGKLLATPGELVYLVARRATPAVSTQRLPITWVGTVAAA